MEGVAGRARWARTAAQIRKSALFDDDWYEFQTGQNFRTRRGAARHYVAGGHRRFSPHPLFEAAWLRHRGLTFAPDEDPLSAYLAEVPCDPGLSPHPLLDLGSLAAASRRPDRLAQKVLEDWLTSASPGDVVPRPDEYEGMPLTLAEIREVAREAVTEWRDLRRLSRKAPSPSALVDWDAARSAQRVGGLTSIVLPVARHPVNAVRWLARLNKLPHDPGAGFEVVLVSSAPDLQTQRLLRCLTASLTGVRLISVAAQLTWPAAVNLGAGAALGDVVVAMHPRLAPWSHEWVAPLASVTRADGTLAQPLVLGQEGVVESAGAGFVDDHRTPHAILRHFPARDVRGPGPWGIPALLSPTFSVRTDDLVALRGLDTAVDVFAETELSLRAHQDAALVSMVVPEAVVTDRRSSFGFASEVEGSTERLRDLAGTRALALTRAIWADAGFRVGGAGPATMAAGGALQVARLRDQPHPGLDVRESPPGLRWTIDTAAPAGPQGELWGDVHFARALANALEDLGQQVAVDRRPARGRETRAHDDVILVLRGLDEVDPRPDRVNLAWVISHPEMVSAEELHGFDAVFAASISWSREATARWGVPVTPLLQCTDPLLFNPARGVADTGEEIVFVGNSRGTSRPVIEAAVSCGVEVAIYGSGWGSRAPAEWVRARSVPNSEVGAMYASAGVVLNDHWPDMREQGFISNRLFDAVASGARVISDPVTGIGELFGGSVQTFASADDLCGLLAGDWRARFPSQPERVATAERIARDHSFAARARVLVDEAARLSVARGSSSAGSG